ncbi:MAG: DUF5004 domain-containing protein [Flavobacteriales bacterium]
MKKLTYIFSILAIATATMFVGCKPETKGELGEPFDKLEGISGTWKISKFSQIDLNNPIQEERDLSEFFIVDGEESTSIVFSKDGQTFTVNPGPGKNYFGTTGTWAFDNNDAPSIITLTNSETLVESEFVLGSIVRSFDNTLVMQLKRVCDDGAGNVIDLVIYKFEFERQ